MTESSAAEKEKRAAAAAAKLEEDRRATEAARLQRAEQQQRTQELQRRAAEEVSGALSCSGIPPCACNRQLQAGPAVAGARAPCFVTSPLMLLCQPEAPTRPAAAGSATVKDLPCALGRADTRITCHDIAPQAHMRVG